MSQPSQLENEVQEQREISIDRTTKISLALVVILIGAMFAGFQWHSNRQQQAFQESQIVLSELRAFRDEFTTYKSAQALQLQAYQSSIEQRFSDLERKDEQLKRHTRDLLPTSVFEIYILRSKEAGTLIDPEPIIQRYQE